jgi:UDP:flavonoid glycosyltransferase YjiC (YdhE family)
MIGLPLFWDQYDNAQRLEETGFGVRLPTYDWTPAQLTGAVDRLLADEALAARMKDISAAVQADPGHVRGADLIEQLAMTGQAVSR